MSGSRARPFNPGHILLRAIPVILLWTYVIAAVFNSAATEMDEFDDAIPLVHGVLVQQGRVPNIDFFSFYPPLGLYVNSTAFSLLGRTIIAPRLFGSFLFVLVILLLKRILSVRTPNSSPLATLVVVLVAASMGAGIILPAWFGVALSVLAFAIYLCAQFQESGGSLLIALSGIVCAIALMYRVNFGAYAVAAVSVDLLVTWWLSDRQGPRFSRIRDLLLPAAFFAIPLVVCSAVLCFSIYGRHTVLALSQFIGTAQKVMTLRGFIDLHLTLRMAFAIMLPASWFGARMLIGKKEIPPKALIPLVLTFGLLFVGLMVRHQVSVAVILTVLEVASVVFLHMYVFRLDRLEFGWLLFFCFHLHYFLSRCDFYHWRFLPFLAAVLFAFLLRTPFMGLGSERESFVSAGTALVVLITAISALLTQSEFKLYREKVVAGAKLIASVARHPSLSDTDRLLGAGTVDPAWRVVYSEDDELKAIHYIRDETSSSNPIFVGVRNHATVFYNNLRIYWLAGRPIGSNVFQLETRVATEPDVQRGIIEDLNRNHVQWVILDNKQPRGDSTFLIRGYVGAHLLDEFIAANFAPKVTFGRFVIYRRR